MTVEIDNRLGRPGSSLARTLARRVQRMLDAVGATDCEVSMSLVDDAAIRGLNAAWRKKDKPTDVLSFPLLEDALGELASAPAGTLLGDIVISVPTATRQAKARRRSLDVEATTLAAHGLLHLFGFDHGSDDTEREMDAYTRVLEAAALNKRPLTFCLSPSSARQRASSRPSRASTAGSSPRR